MNKFFYIVLVSLLLAGCAGPVKQGWQNFTAYYNTFYNAQKFYKEGLEKNLNQTPEINPQIPLRVHVPPSAAGLTEFSEAIERGASILRNHEDSKFVSQALALIGKSYYYRTEYYAALEKFQELQAVGNREEIQRAILWQGRVFLELDNISGGINFLEKEVEQRDEWVPQIRAETELILAQLYTQEQNWQPALDYLVNSIMNIEDPGLKARAFFLQGQLFERTGRNDQALFSYGRITEMRPGYDLEFNARRKVAEITRELGNYEKAHELYSRIERDDKFLDYNDELHYEIARTLQQQGNANLSLEHYKQVLQDRFQPPSDEVRAKTYYGIAEIYRDNIKDFTLAAAYFDSASNTRADPDLLPAFFNAEELAASFGEYASVKKELTELDSLLYLGSLSAEELDSVLVEIEYARSQERGRMQERLEERENHTVFVDETTDNLVEAADGAEDGFLNIRNPQKVRDASLQFQAVWGDRPLDDNWRRRDEVNGSRFTQPVVLTDGQDSETTDSTTVAAFTEPMQAEQDLSRIPLNEDEQEEMAAQIEELNYRLGNIFFLSLNMPDSAKIYYQKVAGTSSRDYLKSRSFYSIAEIELLQGNREKALVKAQRLIQDYPNSVYSEKIAERLDIDHTIQKKESLNDENFYELLVGHSTVNAAKKASDLRKLADKSSEQSRPYILFDAAKEYVKAARQISADSLDERQWLATQEKIRQEKENFAALKDSAEVMLADSLTDNEEKYWRAIADSVFQVPQLRDEFPYEGALWDSARTMLVNIEETYPSSRLIPKVRILRQMLQRPDEKPNEAEIIEGRSVAKPESPVTACNEMDPPVEMKGSMDSFIANISYPDWTRDITMRGEVTYLFTILPDGTVEDYRQESQLDRNGIPQAYEYSIDNYLVFEATQREGKIKCTLDFPINL